MAVGRKIEDERDAVRCLRAAERSGLSPGDWARAHGVDGRSLHARHMNLARRGTSARQRRSKARPKARYQNAHELERNEAGVCRQGACIPRMQCAELCGAALGPELWRRLEPHASACSALDPMEQMQCRDRMVERLDLVEPTQELVDRCLLDCGFPDAKKSLAP